jgi:Cu-Zn family superoxide dismutase
MKPIQLVAGSALISGLLMTAPLFAQEQMKVELINTERQRVGEATITDGPKGVVVRLNLQENPSGISAGAHGFHIHGIGRCEPPFKSAGDHFAPQKHSHGFLSKNGRHAGDMPNIHVPASGALTVEYFVPDVRLKDGKNALLDSDGSALLIHAQPDDYRSDPSGSAGDRIACGVIGGNAAKTTAK